MTRPVPVLAGLLLAILIGASSAVAQQAAAPSPAAPVEPAVGEPEEAASPASVAGDARAALAEIAGLSGQLEDGAAIEAIRSALPETEKRLRAAAEETSEKLEVTEVLVRLEDLESRWRPERTDLDGWDAVVTGRAVEIGERLGRLKAIRGDWERRLEQAGDPDVPKVVRTRIREVLAEIEIAEQRVKTSQARLLELQNRLEGSLDLVVSVIDDVVAAKDRSRSAVLGATAVPLWKIGPRDLSPEGTLAHVRDRWASVEDWVVRRQESLTMEGLLLLVLLAMTLTLRRRAAELAAEDESLTVSAAILQRPVMVAVVLAVLIFALFGPALPRGVRSFHGLIVIFPMVLALRPAFTKRSLPVLWAVTVVFLVERVREMIPAGTGLAQLVQAIEFLAAGGVLLWLYRSGRLREMAAGPTWRWILDLAQPIVLGLIAVAFVADVFGWLGLARLVGQGTLQAIVRAFALWGLVQLAHAVVAISFRSRLAQGLHVVRRRGDVLRRGVSTFLQLGFGGYWILTFLDDFSIRGLVLTGLTDALGKTLELGALAVSAGDLLNFAVAVVLSVYAARFVAFLLDEEVMPRVSLPRGVPYAITTTARYAVLTVGFGAAVSAAGVDLTKFSILAGALGVGIGFGLQNVVNNFVSGLILLFERPIQTGDTISLGELMGEVRHIGIRASTIRSFDGAEVIVPNANLISDQVINWTLSDRQRRLEIPIGVAYGTDPDRVIELLREVLEGRDDLYGGFDPEVHFMGQGESSLDFRVRAWTDNFDNYWNVRSQLGMDIHRALVGAGVEIPFPQRDLHLRSADAGAAESLRASAGSGRPDLREASSVEEERR